MGTRHPSSALLFDLAAGRPDAATQRHVADCERCARALRISRMLLDLARAARGVRGPGPEARRTAEARFRGRRPRPVPAPRALPLLALLFDSWAAPAPAVRSAGGRRERLLRLSGEDLELDLHLRISSRGLDLRGSLDAARPIRRVEAQSAGRRVEAAVDEDGEFELRGLRPGPLRLVLDARVAAEVEL